MSCSILQFPQTNIVKLICVVHLNLRCSIPKCLYNIMVEGQSTTIIANVKNIMYNVKAGLHVSTLLSHLQALVV